MNGSGNQERFFFEILDGSEEDSGDKSTLAVVDFTAHERVSSLFRVELSLASRQETINFDNVLDRPAVLTIRSNLEDRFFHGIISRFSQSGTKGEFYLYEATLVPSMWLLSLKRNCRIFQNSGIQDIVSSVLEAGKVPPDQIEFRPADLNPPREYCTQYRETDLDFISRLIEEEGMFYFFEHDREKHLSVFGIAAGCYRPLEETNVPFHHPDVMVADEDIEEYVYKFVRSRRIHSGKVVLKDYNFARPSLPLECQELADKNEGLEIYDYPGNYGDSNRGSQLAEHQLEAAVLFMDSVVGESNCPRLVPGKYFTLSGHERDEYNVGTDNQPRRYLIAEVRHKGSQPQVLEERAATEAGIKYTNEFVCIPHRDNDPQLSAFREKSTPKPIVLGPQTAIVVGVSGEDSYTDDDASGNPNQVPHGVEKTVPYGMVKVQFHWDRDGQRDENSSCWVRVAYPYAGERHGMQFTPLIGDEVLVVFLEGDPDRPVVAGSLFKGDHAALLSRNDMIQNKILTPYQHQFLLNDKGGSVTMNTGGGQTVKLADGGPSSDHGNNIKISTSDGHSVHLAGGTVLQGIESKTQGSNFVLLDDQNNKVEIDSPGLVRLHQGSNNQHMDDSATHIWRGSNHISITDDSIHLYHGDYHVLVDASQVKLYSGNNAVRLGPDMISITHESQVRLKVGPNTVTLSGEGVEISGTTVDVTAQTTMDIHGLPVKINCT